MATFTTGVEPSYTSAIPTTTSAPDPPPETPPNTNVMAIAIGVVFGTLVAALVVLSVCLWRAKRKRARNRGIALGSDDGKGGGGYDRNGASSPAPSSAIIELESGGVAKAAEMPVEERRHEMPSGDGRLVAEMPAEPLAPVELPAELPANLHLPARRPSLVSHLTSDSRRTSLENYTVSPATLTQRRTSLTKS